MRVKVTIANVGVWCAVIAACSAAVAQAEVTPEPPVPSVEAATDAAITQPMGAEVPVSLTDTPSPPEASPQTADTPSAADVFAPQEQVNPAIANGYLSPNNEWNTSVMFVPSQMRKLRQVVEVYEQNRDFFASNQGGNDVMEDILKWDAGVSKSDNPAANLLPSFFLASIVYYKTDDWSVWLGGRKITFEENSENAELYIEAISKSKVTAVWRPSAIERVLSRWNQEQLTEYSLEGGDIHLDRKKGTIRFSVRVNQSFNSGLAQVVEGKSAPIQIQVKSAGAKPTNQPRPEEQAMSDDSIDRMMQPGMKDPEQISKELMDQYKMIGKIVPKRGVGQ